MKRMRFFLPVLLLVNILTGCSQNTPETDEEPIVEGPTMAFDTTLSDPMDQGDEPNTPQAVLDDFLLAFSETEKLPCIRYSNAYEYESTTERYYYEADRLKGVFIDHGIEGGGGGQFRILYTQLPDQSFTENFLYVPYYASEYEKGYFCYFLDGKNNCVEVSGNDDFYHPKFVGPIEEQSSLDGSFDKSLLLKNVQKFILRDGSYSWDIRREKVNSEYGEIEIYETIQVDSVLFVEQFKGQINELTP